MKDNKKYDVNDLYYATIIYDEYNKGYGIFKINKNVIDINTEAQYKIKFIVNNYIILEDDIKIKGITPFKTVLPYMCGKYQVNHILNEDKHILKKYNDEIDEYTFTDIDVVQNNNKNNNTSSFKQKQKRI